MSIHKRVSERIFSFLENIYYNNLKKLYNENLENIFQYCKFPVIKPEYFVYLQYYFIYLFFHYVTYKKTIRYSISLHLTHISGNIYNEIVKKYNYTPIYNVAYLMKMNYMLFYYMLFLKISFLNSHILKKIFMIFIISIFYSGMIINETYKDRLLSIENKEEFRNNLKILIISPNKKFIENVVNKTEFFTYSNLLLFINAVVYLFI